jgi:hypothetical protein
LEDNVTLDERLSTMVRQFENAEEVTRSARQGSEKCRDYFDDKQLTEEEETALKKRGQPAVVFNEIKPKVKTLLGLEKQTRKDPKAFPRNPDDEEAARAATDAIRFVCDASRWDDVRSKGAKNLAIEGTCAVMVGVKQGKQGIDPDIRRVAWDRFYYDPHSNEDDFTDAAFMGVVIWMDLDDAKGKYPEAEEALTATWAQAKDTETYDDKPKWNLWADYKRKRVRLCEHYYRENGVWMFCIFTQAGFVVEPSESPYIDEAGEPECPIKAISLYVDRDNNRYGEVQAMLSPQDEINKRRSKSLHLINTRQVRVSPNVAQDPNEVRKELARPDGVFVGEQGDVEVFQTNDMAMGNLNLMQDAREHIHRTGANSAMAGKDTGGQSGKAIALQQMGGMTEAADFLDCIRRLSLMVYSAVWARVRQHWTAERWIRVTDNENNVRFVGLNRPITVRSAIEGALQGDKASAKWLPQISPDLPAMVGAMAQGSPVAGQMLQQVAMGPSGEAVVGIENSVTELDVDIIVDEGIDTPTVQAEQFETVAKMLPGAPPQIQPILWQTLIENSAFRNKEKVLEALNQPPPPDPVAEQMKQIAVEGEAAKVDETKSKTVKNLADAEATEAQTQISAFQAGSDVARAA